MFREPEPSTSKSQQSPSRQSARTKKRVPEPLSADEGRITKKVPATPKKQVVISDLIKPLTQLLVENSATQTTHPDSDPSRNAHLDINMAYRPGASGIGGGRPGGVINPGGRCIAAPAFNGAAARKLLRVNPLAENLSYAYLLSEQGNLEIGAEGYNAEARLLDMTAIVIYKLSSNDLRITAEAIRTGLMIEGFGRYAPAESLYEVGHVLDFYRRVFAYIASPKGLEDYGITIAAYHTLIRNCCGFAEQIEINGEIYEAITRVQALAILRALHARIANDYAISATSLFAAAIVSYCKRGSASEQFLNKVNQDIRAAHAENIQITHASIRDFWAVVSAWIPQNGARDLFDDLANAVPIQLSTRLALTIQQTAGSGLTAFRVIGHAIRTHRRFRWDIVRQIFGVEWENYMRAVEAVAGDVYYGFRSDLAAARSTQFRNLTFICKELLIRCDGKETLRNYRGWPPTMARQEEFMTLITDYITAVRRVDALVNIEPQLEEGQDGMDENHINAIHNAQNADIFTF